MQIHVYSLYINRFYCYNYKVEASNSSLLTSFLNLAARYRVHADPDHHYIQLLTECVAGNGQKSELFRPKIR